MNKILDTQIPLKIYCASPITGFTGTRVFGYYRYITDELQILGYTVLQPMVNKGVMVSKKKFAAGNYKSTNPSVTNKAIKHRDCWMVQQADVVLMDFTEAKVASIGCVSELAWADLLGKHTVTVMDKSNIHNHAFVLEESDVIFTNIEDALTYLKKLINQEF